MMNIILSRITAYIIDATIMVLIYFTILYGYKITYEINHVNVIWDIRSESSWLKYMLFHCVTVYPIICAFIFNKRTVGMKFLSLYFENNLGLKINKLTFISRQIIFNFIFIFGVVFPLILIFIFGTFLFNKPGHIIDWMFNLNINKRLT